MKPKILATPKLPLAAVTLLREEFDVCMLPVTGRISDDLDIRANEIRAIATPGGKPGVKLDGELFDQFPNLEIISSFSNGLDAIDVQAAFARNVVVTHAPGAMAESVADIALALALDLMRGISKGADYVRAGRWARDGNMPLAISCQRKIAGIIGLGRIGNAVARRLTACGMSVLYNGRSQQPQMPYAYCSDLPKMARASDVLIVCCPSTPATVGLVDETILRELGPKGFLINVARGNVVDEMALIEALERRTIAGAGLDVCNNEPNPQPSLVALDNVIVLPHLGAATVETRNAMFEVMVTNLRCHFLGLPLPDLYRMS